MTGSWANGTIRFDAFEFDERSGELRRVDGESESTTRLSPQPAKLLAHLVRRRPDVVGAEEIRELLWPDVQVEFEQSLHSCVRQVRAALGDSASEPRYVETIPRRGYRFLGEVESNTAEAIVAPIAAPPPDLSTRVSARRGRRRTPLAVAAIALTLLVTALALRDGAPPNTLRIAVMPFEPMSESSPLPAGNDIAESIVERLASQRNPPLEIVGPTTTQAYDDSAEHLRTLIDEFDIDFVVNARETGSDSGPRVLVELIRAADGAHVWVRYLDEFPLDVDVTSTITGAVEVNCRAPRE